MSQLETTQPEDRFGQVMAMFQSPKFVEGLLLPLIGIVLFLFALSMIFGESKPDEEVKLASGNDTAIYPLAVPSIAGPGAMLTAVLMTETARFSVVEQLQTAGVMLVVLLLCYVMMLAAGFINRFIGNTGASVVSRVMGLILASVATANTLAGFKLYFDL